jgi:hypothetical protein
MPSSSAAEGVNPTTSAANITRILRKTAIPHM